MDSAPTNSGTALWESWVWVLACGPLQILPDSSFAFCLNIVLSLWRQKRKKNPVMINRLTHQLVFYCLWSWDGQSGGCLSWWYQQQPQTHVSTHEAERHTACGTDAIECPLNTSDHRLSPCTSHTCRKHIFMLNSLSLASTKTEAWKMFFYSLVSMAAFP